jgi:predicted ABC-type ATPase
MGEANSERPHVVVIAGPNGAGKTTAAASLLPNLGVADFVNADVLARGLSQFRPESVALQTGRIMLDRLHQLAAARQTFAFETT